MNIVTILQRGQLTLPKPIRERAGITEGDDLFVYVNAEGQVVLQVLPKPGSLLDMIGTVKPLKPLDLNDARRKAHAERGRARAAPSIAGHDDTTE